MTRGYIMSVCHYASSNSSSSRLKFEVEKTVLSGHFSSVSEPVLGAAVPGASGYTIVVGVISQLMGWDHSCKPLRKHPTAAAKYSLVAILYSHNLIGNPLLWNSAQLLWNMPTPNSLMGIPMLIPPGGGNSSNCPPSSHFSRELPGVGAESSTSLLPGRAGPCQ